MFTSRAFRLDRILVLIALLPIAARELPARAADTIDIVGSTLNTAALGGAGKGNVFRIDTSVSLHQQEYFLNLSGTHTLSFYVYQSPVEFGTYTQVFKTSRTVTGNGADWYSSGPVDVPLQGGRFYLLPVSWTGSVTYFYGVADSQAVSFGADVHGYAFGTDPMGTTISTTDNDQAIYNQRITTGVPEPAFMPVLCIGEMVLRRRSKAARAPALWT